MPHLHDKHGRESDQRRRDAPEPFAVQNDKYMLAHPVGERYVPVAPEHRKGCRRKRLAEVFRHRIAHCRADRDRDIAVAGKVEIYDEVAQRYDRYAPVPVQVEREDMMEGGRYEPQHHHFLEHTEYEPLDVFYEILPFERHRVCVYPQPVAVAEDRPRGKDGEEQYIIRVCEKRYLCLRIVYEIQRVYRLQHMVRNADKGYYHRQLRKEFMHTPVEERDGAEKAVYDKQSPAPALCMREVAYHDIGKYNIARTERKQLP